ncbi:hypothetical protein E4656_03865 [Natronospirillum operosum]|uniref:Thioredoxin domain-containing protein n=1 Tax=Natronospirillum operosum TaxID=2759953 RepID=A0A4Z0WCK4_9GAMM|nr:hypothetical protein [Natronospirillum operosum]TGG95564.1 hypothetical protein E4656_03865 [Natronospirillum operosum]
MQVSTRLMTRLVLLLLLVLFMAPIFWAQIAVQRGWLENTEKTTNFGERLKKPVAFIQLGPMLDHGRLEPQELSASWWLVYVLPNPCTDSCRVRLTQIEDILAAVDAPAGRVRALLLDPSPGRAEALPVAMSDSVVHLDAHASAINRALGSSEAVAVHEPAGEAVQALYLMNPQGSLMMKYSAETEDAALVGGIRSDIERLL